jgi:hypothetical protein
LTQPALSCRPAVLACPSIRQTSVEVPPMSKLITDL